jgi:tRNA A37 threonylcarbamoyladenosine biosynthesis protein TsaE
MEALGCLLHSLCVPGTVILLSGHLGSGKTAIARGIVRAFCGDPAMFVPSPTFLLNLTYQEDLAHDKVWWAYTHDSGSRSLSFHGAQ